MRNDMRAHRQNSVVREEERVGNNIPSFGPRDFLLVDEDSHQFRDSKSWVSLYEMMSTAAY